MANDKQEVSDLTLAERAVALAQSLMDKGLHTCTELIFRELVAVRDQSAKYTTAEEWKRLHEEIIND